MEPSSERSAGKKGKEVLDKQQLLPEGAVSSDDTTGRMYSMQSIPLGDHSQTENSQAHSSSQSRKNDDVSLFPREAGKGIEMTTLAMNEVEEELEEEENHEGPLLDPKMQPVNKLPIQWEDFDNHLTGPVRYLVLCITSTMTFMLMGSTLVLAVCLMPGMEGTIDTVAPVAAALLMLSLMGSLIWCCWLGWNQCWFAATKDNLIRRLPFTRLHMLKPNELVKVKGRVAVGPDGPLTATYSHQMNCVFTEACLYKYDPDGVGTQKSQGDKWALDRSERRAVDFFLVDDETGRSTLVKAGYGAGVTTIVPVKEVVETEKGSTKRENKTPKLESWLEERDKTSYLPGEPDTDRRQEWLKFTESYLRAGDYVLVAGNTERRGDQIVIVSPDESLSYGCRFWFLCVLPFHLRGLIITNESRMTGDVPKTGPVTALPEASV